MMRPTSLSCIGVCLAFAILSGATATAGEARLAATEGTVVATRIIRSKSVLGPSDVTVINGATPGAYAQVEDVVGLEARVSLYVGRPLRLGDLGPPALLERNQLITMSFARGGLSIVAEGRALGRAGLGERVRVLNLGSKAVVTGRVVGPGEVTVGQ